jgi:hypothetical protein
VELVPVLAVAFSISWGVSLRAPMKLKHLLRVKLQQLHQRSLTALSHRLHRFQAHSKSFVIAENLKTGSKGPVFFLLSIRLQSVAHGQ